MRDTVVSATQVAAIKVPMRGIVGSADPALKDFRELQAMLPALHLEVVDGASHVSTPTRPEFLRAVSRFLAANGAP